MQCVTHLVQRFRAGYATLKSFYDYNVAMTFIFDDDDDDA